MLRLLVAEVWAHRLSLFISLFFGVIIVAMIELFFGPIAWLLNVNEVGRLRNELPLAAARWQAQAIADYEVYIEAEIPFCWFDVTLSVRGGEVVSVEEHDVDLIRLGICPRTIVYSDYTISSMYANATRTLAALDTDVGALRVEFDPIYSHITFYRTECHYRTHSIGDCIEEIRFSNFRPVLTLTPQAP